MRTLYKLEKLIYNTIVGKNSIHIDKIEKLYWEKQDITIRTQQPNKL
ncbi:MAG: hypothetical protein RSB10_02050 [Clostridia bacterium]